MNDRGQSDNWIGLVDVQYHFKSVVQRELFIFQCEFRRGDLGFIRGFGRLIVAAIRQNKGGTEQKEMFDIHSTGLVIFNKYS